MTLEEFRKGLKVGNRVSVALPDYMTSHKSGTFVEGSVVETLKGSMLTLEINHEGAMGRQVIHVSSMWVYPSDNPLESLTSDPEACQHVWEVTGSSPTSGEIWENCSRCGIKREDV